MKQPLTILILGALFWGGLAASDAQAVTVRVEGVSARHSDYRGHHRSYERRRHHRRATTWVPGHYIWRNHHRIFIPGHSVVRYR